MLQGRYHVPVLLNETVNALNIFPGGTYVDCTFGGGGHSAAILDKLDSGGRLIAFDQDAAASKNLPKDERIIFVPHNFRHISRFLKFHHHPKVNGILADLGVSSHQIDKAERGFSTRFDAFLDMRMNQSQDLDAAKIVATYTEEKLHKIFEEYGEVTNSKTLAKLIVATRRTQPIKSIAEFKRALYDIVKGNPEKYFAKVFQALRIEVNDELSALKELVTQVPDLLMEGGRAVFITFHSLEDRIVKNFFRYGHFEERQNDNVYGIPAETTLKVISKKPVVPSDEEIKTNPRSRSAKLRVAEKVSNSELK